MHELAAVCCALSGLGAAQHASAAEGLPAVAAAIDSCFRAHLFDPHVLDDAPYRALQRQVEQLATEAGTDDDFVKGFNRLWRSGPFSHVRLGKARQTAAQTADFVDTLRVGGRGASLHWQDDVAVLTVTTMMGQDTIEQIDAAFDRIVARPAKALIVDLRKNPGGAFAVRPLVGHLVDAPFDAGMFLSQRWTAAHSAPPLPAQVQQLAPWEGWSLKAFWRDVAEQGVLRIRFVPTAPHYGGPVFVLTSHQTASAAELAVDALLAAGRATMVGERTAGQMLSQKVFDLPNGLQLWLPVADYVARHTGRIEGQGVAPSVPSDAAAAMDVALGLARAARPTP